MSTRITGNKGSGRPGVAAPPAGAPPAKPPTAKAAPPPGPAPSAKPRKGLTIGGIREYLGEVWAELRKTTWPSKTEFWQSVQLVIGVMVVVGLYIAISDLALAQVFKVLLPRR